MESSRPVVAELESVLERKSTECRCYVIFIIFHTALLRQFKFNYSRPSGDRPKLIWIQTTTAESSTSQRSLDLILFDKCSFYQEKSSSNQRLCCWTISICLQFIQTWLDPGDKNIYHVWEICPTGYDFHHIPRADSNGGGVGLLG